MDSFLKTILILLLVYYGLKILFKFSKPYLMRYIAKKAEERFGQSFGTDPFSNSQNQNNDEGKVIIEKKTAKSKPTKPIEGEYVDYEEVE